MQVIEALLRMMRKRSEDAEVAIHAARGLCVLALDWGDEGPVPCSGTPSVVAAFDAAGAVPELAALARSSSENGKHRDQLEYLSEYVDVIEQLVAQLRNEDTNEPSPKRL